MKEKLQIRDSNDPRLVYRLSDRASRISLRVNHGERIVTVTVPGRRALPRAKAFVREKQDWIHAQLAALPAPQPFVPGAGVLFKGGIYELVCPGSHGRPRSDEGARQIIVPAHADTFSGRVRRLLIHEAREALTEATHKYARLLDKEVGKISVRDTHSRWGSCVVRDGRGHISYSWRLVCAPGFVLDYVCAHESAHMIHNHHGPEFWQLTEHICPHTAHAREWLKTNGAALHAVGSEH
ncbi:MAG: M48 family metallopeptidase [Hyphomonadaceae bacterium]|nr:M48 family metallopeptidase [Hyphomonadaceae bacterium]